MIAAHAADGCGCGAVDALDAGARAGQRHELDVEDVVETQIRGVALRAGDALDAADTARDRPIQLASVIESTPPPSARRAMIRL